MPAADGLICSFKICLISFLRKCSIDTMLYCVFNTFTRQTEVRTVLLFNVANITSAVC